MAKNNSNKSASKPTNQSKSFWTNRKRLTTMSRVLALVLVAAMVITTLFTWGLGLVD